MTQIDKEVVERLKRIMVGSSCFPDLLFPKADVEAVIAALGAAEARECAAVAEERERCAQIADERALMLEAYATFGEKEKEFLLMAKGARDAAKFIRETNDG
jgi:uncharacterized protein YqfA (UPF0365 family)